eukprot:SAG22_NODE_21933_length_252_cov_2.379085_1_plen_55_part_01
MPTTTAAARRLVAAAVCSLCAFARLPATEATTRLVPGTHASVAGAIHFSSRGDTV